MKINREAFLNDLEMVKAGLSPREFIEQSSCLVFQDKMVMTFNDEIACRKPINIDITGAIQAASLLAILEKMDDPELTVGENDEGELEFKGKRKRFGVTKDAEIFLPVDKVEMPEKWRELPKEFTEAVGLVQHCVSTDESRFLLTCIHLHPDYIEACDNLQVMRCQIKTGLKDSVLVRGTSLGHIVSLGMDKIALTKAWIHFRNQQGLVFSCRRYAEDYPGLDKIISFKGHSIGIPRGLADASDRAAIFAVDKAGDALVTVTIKDRMIRIVGEGLSGWFKEVKKVNYEGPPMEFLIAPELLKHISEKYTDAQITEDKLKVLGGSWEYVTVLGKPKAEDDEASEEDEE
jgi:DNA polymerase III sliding clamp (beta) subunit (PCNA family)